MKKLFESNCDELVSQMIDYIKEYKVKVNKYVFKDEKNYEFTLKNNNYTLSVDDDLMTLYKNDEEISDDNECLDVLYSFLKTSSFVKESASSIFKNSSLKNVPKFEDFLNEAKVSKEAKIIKDLIDLIEEKEDIKVQYKEKSTPKLLVDIEFKFKVDGDTYNVIKQKTITGGVITIIINKNDEEILNYKVDSKSLVALVYKLDKLLINLHKGIKESLENDEDDYNSDDLKDVESMIYDIKNTETKRITINSDVIKTDEELNYFEFDIDDITYIFEFGDEYFYAEKNGISVIDITSFTTEISNKVEELKETITEIFNEKFDAIESEIEEKFESKTMTFEKFISRLR